MESEDTDNEQLLEGDNSDQTQTGTTIDDLQDDVMEHILAKLKDQDLLRARLVCRRWYYLFYLPSISNQISITIKPNRFYRKNHTIQWLTEHKHVSRSIVLESIDFQEFTAEEILKIWKPIAKNVRCLRITTCQLMFAQFVIILSCTKNLRELHLDRLTVLDEAYYDTKLDMKTLNTLPEGLLDSVVSFSFTYYLTLTNELFKFFADRMPNIVTLFITRVVETPEENADIKWHTLLDFIQNRSDKLQSLKIEGWAVTQESIQDMLVLKDLKLKSLIIKVVYYDAKEDSIMNDFLRNQSSLETLILNSWSVSDGNFRAICDNLSNLQTLEISNSYRLTSDGITMMSKLEKLQKLSVFSPQVTYDGLRKALLLRENKSLEYLDFSGSGDKFHFIESLQNLSNLRSLRLGCYNYVFTDAMLRAIIESLSEQGLLEELVLTDAEISDDGITGANCGGVSIARLRNLKILSLKYMDGVTDKSIDELSKLNRLEVLSLERSKVTDVGIQELVKHIPVLQTLDISNCGGIGDDGIRAIIDNFEYLKTLELEYGHFKRTDSEILKEPKYKARIHQLFGLLE